MGLEGFWVYYFPATALSVINYQLSIINYQLSIRYGLIIYDYAYYFKITKDMCHFKNRVILKIPHNFILHSIFKKLHLLNSM